MIRKKTLGKLGENIAIDYLKDANYCILEKNFKCRFGEVDIIAKKNNILIFIEVKTRTSLNYGHPSEAIDNFKIKKLRNIADFYTIEKNLEQNYDIGFDVISILISKSPFGSIKGIKKDKKIYRESNFKIQHLRNAF